MESVKTENTMIIARGFLNEISEIPRPNVLYLEGWSVQYFENHSWEDFIRRLNEVEFLSCSKNVGDSLIEYVFDRDNGITVSINIPKIDMRQLFPIKINETRPKMKAGDVVLSF